VTPPQTDWVLVASTRSHRDLDAVVLCRNFEPIYQDVARRPSFVVTNARNLLSDLARCRVECLQDLADYARSAPQISAVGHARQMMMKSTQVFERPDLRPAVRCIQYAAAQVVALLTCIHRAISSTEISTGRTRS